LHLLPDFVLRKGGSTIDFNDGRQAYAVKP